ncbi:hypothetical protein [Kosmotoga pacifica]|uniref:Type II and III secretion system protein n=1 Tax=Kosmotoga pacifica TaxID=1330330 RepID=A0A0G2Z8I8_9BACT|nr:hypothetical protein [Kosmotoga pacifica]AKI97925.1 hypothetical protein IX53_08945 [Kosmotoga pacifica]
MKKHVVILLVLISVVFTFPNSLKTLVPSMDELSTIITLTFTGNVSEFDYELQSNPSKTIYTLTLNGIEGKDMDLPLRAGTVEGLWTRDLGDRYSVNVALLIPAKKEPDIIVKEKSIILRFWRSNVKVSIDKFSTFGMKLGSALTYLMSSEILDLSYVVTPSVRDLQLNVGFTSIYPEDILRNILISLGSEVSYAYFTDGTLYVGTPEEVKKVVNAFWKTYTGVDIGQEVDGQNQLELLRKALPINAFLEYIPNESIVLAFGDLETHMMISKLLTSAYVRTEYIIETTLQDSYDSFLNIAQKVNSALFDNKITITSVPELYRLVLSGNKRDVERLKEYLDNYAATLKSEAEKSRLKVVTVNLPENFGIVEDVLSTGRGTTVTLVDLIVELLKGYIPEEKIEVDRTFESLGKVTFKIPETYAELLKEVVSDISIKSQNIGYRIIKTKYIDPQIIEHVQKLASVEIEALGEKGGYIIKGVKRNIDVAEYLISDFSGGSTQNIEGKFIQLKDPEGFDAVKSFLEKFFQKNGLNSEDYTVESVAGRLIYIEAPSNVLISALQELGRYEKQLFDEAVEEFVELPHLVYEGGIGDLLDAMFKGQLDYIYVPSVELLIIRGSKENVARIKDFIEKMRPGIESKLKASKATGERKSVFISKIPGWDVEKFKSYFEQFLGSDVFSTLKVIEADAGYYIIAESNVTESIKDEVERLKEIESPYYTTVEDLPPVQELLSLFESLGINVNIMPVDNRYIIVGTRDNVLRAQQMLKQIQSGYEKTGVATQTEEEGMLYEFVDIPEDTLDDFQSILDKLGISVELIKSPTGVLVIGYSDAVDRALETIDKILQRRAEEQDRAIEKGYAVLRKVSGVDLDALKTLVSSFSYNISLVPAADNIVVVGPERDIEEFLKLYQELSSAEKSFAFVEKSLSREEIQSIINTLELQLKLLETTNKFIVYGDPVSISTLQRLIENVTAESAISTETVITVEGTPVTPVMKEARVIESPVSAQTLSTITKELGLEISLHETDRGLVATGTPSQLDRFEELLDSLTGLPEFPESRFVLVPSPLPFSAEKLEEQFKSLQLQVKVFDSAPFGYILIGPAADIKSATQFVEYLKKQGQTRTEIYELPPAVTYESVESLLKATGFNLTLSEVGNSVVITGKDEDVSLALSLLSGFAEKAQRGGFTYKLVSKPSGISTDELKTALKSIGYNVNLLDFAGLVVLIGTPEEVKNSEEFIKYISPEPSMAATEEEKSYEIVGIPEGFSVTDVQTIVRKIGIEVEIVSAGEATLLVGSSEAIADAKGIIATLSSLGRKPEELVEYSYNTRKVIMSSSALSISSLEPISTNLPATSIASTAMPTLFSRSFSSTSESVVGSVSTL